MILILILLFTICYSNDQLEYKINILKSPEDNQIGFITCKFNIENYTKYICNNITNCDKKPNSDITENELFFIKGLCRDTLISYFNHNYFDLTPTTTKFDSTGSWCVNFKISLVRPRVYDTIKEYNTKIITQDTIKKYVTVYDTIKEYNKIQ